MEHSIASYRSGDVETAFENPLVTTGTCQPSPFLGMEK